MISIQVSSYDCKNGMMTIIPPLKLLGPTDNHDHNHDNRVI